MNFADYLDQFGGGMDDQSMPSAVPDSTDPSTPQSAAPSPIMAILEQQRRQQQAQMEQAARAKALRDALLQEEVAKNKNLENTLNNTFTEGGKIKSAQDAAWEQYAKQFGGSYDPNAGKMQLGLGGKIGMALQAMSNGIAAAQNKQQYVSPQDMFFAKALKDLEQQRDSATTLLNSRSQRTADSLVRASQGDSQQAITQEKNTNDAQLKSMTLDLQKQKMESDAHIKQLDEAIKMLKAQADSGVAGAREKLLEAQTLHEAVKQRKDEADTQIKAIEQKFGKNAIGQAAGIMAENQGLDPKSPEGVKQWLANWEKIGNATQKTPTQLQSYTGAPDFGTGPIKLNERTVLLKGTNDINSDPVVKAYKQIVPVVSEVNTMLQRDPTSLTDTALTENFAKIIDNMTSVKSQEFDNVKKAMGPLPTLSFLFKTDTPNDPNRSADGVKSNLVQNLGERAKGRFLDDNTRQEIVRIINNYHNSLQSYTNEVIRGKASELSDLQGWDPAKVTDHYKKALGALQGEPKPEGSSVQQVHGAPFGAAPAGEPTPPPKLDQAQQDVYQKAFGLRKEINQLENEARLPANRGKLRDYMNKIKQKEQELLDLTVKK